MKKKLTKDAIKKLLEKYNIQSSYQRLRIYEFLCNSQSHPTVEMIYKELANEIPTLSKTTIYNTLKLFEQKGLIISLNIDENESRYDANLIPHLHFKCKACGKIFDIKYKSSVMKLDTLDGHRIQEVKIYLSGICRECAKYKNKKLDI